MKEYPFSHYTEKRKNAFSDAYTSIIMFDEIEAYLNLLAAIGSPARLLKDGKFTLDTVNTCVNAIDREYQPKKLLCVLEKILGSFTEDFMHEDFEFFQKSFPDRTFRMSNMQVRKIENILSTRFAGMKMVLKDLIALEGRIDQAFCEIYKESLDFAPKTTGRKGVGTVSKVCFAFDGVNVGSAFSSKTDMKKQNTAIDNCMKLVVEFLRRVSSFHQFVLASYCDFHKAMELVCEVADDVEIKMFNALQNEKTVHAIFKEYYQTELKEIEDSFKFKGDKNSVSFIVSKVNEYIADYNAARAA